MTIEEAIAAALEEWARTPMVYGVSDCGLAVADIYRAALGVDIAAHLRGRYADRDGYEALLGRRGVLGCARAICRRQKWQRCEADKAETGDPGVVASLVGPSFAIRYHDRWLVRADHGFSVLADDAVLACWRVS